MLPTSHRSRFPVTALLALAACAPTGTKATGNTGADLPPELAHCRASTTTSSVAEIALRTAHNLGIRRVAERAGRELHVRTHPDNRHVVFARERTPGDAATADLYVADTAGSAAEVRLTTDNTADARPCWSPTGDRVLFVSTRAGEPRLFVAAADGQNPTPLLAAPPGTTDDEPDWSRSADRIVFTRREPNGHRRLMLLNGDGTGLVPLTAGAVVGSAELGQHEPAFSPDGQRVAFVQVVAPGVSRLHTVEVANGVETQLFDPAGDVRMPRWSPQQDRIFCTLAQPSAFRPGLRLAALTATGQDARLIEPGAQWQALGADPWSSMPPARAEAAPEELSTSAFTLQISAGVPVQGSKSMLAEADGQTLALATETFDGHEIAGINCVFTLPVARADDVVAVTATLVARVTRSDAATALRTSVYDAVQERFDTVAVVPQPGTGMRTFGFSMQSLAHVSLERQLRVTVIAEIGAGARAELHIDQVLLSVVRAAATAR